MEAVDEARDADRETPAQSGYLGRITGLLETVPDCAAALGVTRQYVLQLIADGKLESIRLGRNYFVSALSLQEYMEARARRALARTQRADRDGR